MSFPLLAKLGFGTFVNLHGISHLVKLVWLQRVICWNALIQHCVTQMLFTTK